MTYKLYLKTHNKTGLMYLGMTTQEDAHVYRGSGDHWKSHYLKHGYDVTTDILFETTDHEKFKSVCRQKSNTLDVVRNPSYANLIPETGDSANPQAHKAAAKKIKDSIWVTDGERDYRIQSGYLPGGFQRGRSIRWKQGKPKGKPTYYVDGIEYGFNEAVQKFGVGIKKTFGRMRNQKLTTYTKSAYANKPQMRIDINYDH